MRMENTGTMSWRELAARTLVVVSTAVLPHAFSHAGTAKPSATGPRYSGKFLKSGPNAKAMNGFDEFKIFLPDQGAEEEAPTLHLTRGDQVCRYILKEIHEEQVPAQSRTIRFQGVMIDCPVDHSESMFGVLNLDRPGSAGKIHLLKNRRTSMSLSIEHFY